MTTYFFFLGTEAELIKTFPVIRVMEERHIPYCIIASGQNDISKSRVLEYTNGGRIDLELSHEKDITKSGKGLLEWYLRTYRVAGRLIKSKFPELTNNAGDSVMIVHGDTISTVMGAYIGKKLGMKVAHIEAGLRSHHLLNPFPEEIDRIFVDRISDYLFVPGNHAENNIRKRVGINIYDTKYNTLIDSLIESENVKCTDDRINSIIKDKYFVFVLHRQENMQNDKLIEMLMHRLFRAVEDMNCVVILHKITRDKLDKMGYLNQLESDNRFALLPRTDYFDFMKLLSHAEYVITDGGSNQGELSYMGVPTLIMRQSTEQEEGIGENILLYGGDDNVLDQFLNHYKELRHEKKIYEKNVSDLIVDALISE